MVFRHHVFIGMATDTLALVQYKTRLYLLQVTGRVPCETPFVRSYIHLPLPGTGSKSNRVGLREVRVPVRHLYR
jgi:hypothetical protein